MSTFSISGNTSVALSSVHYSGAAIGSVDCDAAGNYTIPGLAPGTYFISVVSGIPVIPKTQPVTVVDADVTDVNFSRATVAGVIDSFDGETGYIRCGDRMLVWFHVEEWNSIGGFTFPLTEVSVGETNVQYIGTIAGGADGGLIGLQLTIRGFSNAVNNVSITVANSDATFIQCAKTHQIDEQDNAFAGTTIPTVGMNVLFDFAPGSSSAINISAA